MKEMKERYAVEARIFDNGKIVAKIRTAEYGEESGCRETKRCDVWVDIFDEIDDAVRFLRDYRGA